MIRHAIVYGMSKKINHDQMYEYYYGFDDKLMVRFDRDDFEFAFKSYYRTIEQAINSKSDPKKVILKWEIKEERENGT